MHHVDITDMWQHRFYVEFSNTSCYQRNPVTFCVFDWVLSSCLGTMHCSLHSRSTELRTQLTSAEKKLCDDSFNNTFLVHLYDYHWRSIATITSSYYDISQNVVALSRKRGSTRGKKSDHFASLSFSISTASNQTRVPIHRYILRNSSVLSHAVQF